MSNVTFLAGNESGTSNETGVLIVVDFAQQAEAELAGRGVLAWTGMCVGGAVTLQAGPLAA